MRPQSGAASRGAVLGEDAGEKCSAAIEPGQLPNCTNCMKPANMRGLSRLILTVTEIQRFWTCHAITAIIYQ